MEGWLVSGMKVVWTLWRRLVPKHCPGPTQTPPQPPLSLSSGSVATSGIEQNRQRAVLSQLPAGGSPEGLDVLLNKYSRLHLGMFFQVESLLCEDNNYNLLDLVIK